MTYRRKKKTLLIFLLLAICLLTACGGTTPAPNSPSAAQNPSSVSDATSQTSDKTDQSSAQTSDTNAEKKGTRDNTPVIRTPEASGSTVYSSEIACIDASHTDEGYLMANYTGTNEKVKLQITGPDGVTYTYNLHGTAYEVFPLTAGDGVYTVGIYENISDTTYAAALSTDVNAALSDPLTPYLYPNQYVNFNETSLPVKKSAELAVSADTDAEVIELVYNYVTTTFTYDYDKAASVTSGYLPVIDEVYQAQTGICFDYAAVIAAMLRSQKIPTRLEVGYLGEQYHAWISVYLQESGWLNGIISFADDTWTLLDPTSASASKTPETFLAETDQYTTKYLY